MPRRKKGLGPDSKSSILAINKGKPQQRNAANARERARMRVLSKAFCKLKTTLPWVPVDTKLSKLDTLRLASSYIKYLKQMVTAADEGELSPSDPNFVHPDLKMTWPFGFNRPTSLPEGTGSPLMEDDDGGSEESWESESPDKDCIHLENACPQPDLLEMKHFSIPHEESPYKAHGYHDYPCNNNNLPFNFHRNQQPVNGVPYFHNSDVISLS